MSAFVCCTQILRSRIVCNESVNLKNVVKNTRNWVTVLDIQVSPTLCHDVGIESLLGK